MSTKIIPISDLRREASQVLKTLREGSDVVYVTQHGRPAAVLVGFEQYENLLAQLETLTELTTQQEYTIKRNVEYKVAEPKNTFSALAEMAEDLGVDDLAENHDHYLYGVDKQ